MAQITMEAARVNARLTQEELAKKLGVSRTTVINVEKGYVDPKASYVIAFCSIVGMSVDDIIMPKESTLSRLECEAE